MCERTYNLAGFPTASEVSEGDQRLFVMEAKTFEDLCVGLSQPCVCSGRWKLHVCIFLLLHARCLKSGNLSGKCSGMR